MKIREIKDENGKTIAYEWDGLYYSPEEKKRLEKLDNARTASDIPSDEVRFMFMNTEEYLAYLKHEEKPKKEEDDD